MPLRGSCHCGRIAYRLDAEPTEAIECNCSICRRKGALLAAVAPEQFHLETGRDDIAVYTFGKHVIRHQFCKACGCAPFSEGTGPNGEAMVAVNLRCADNLDLSTIKITQFDGASLWAAEGAASSGRRHGSWQLHRGNQGGRQTRARFDHWAKAIREGRRNLNGRGDRALHDDR